MLKFPILFLILLFHCSFMAQETDDKKSKQGKWIDYGKENSKKKTQPEPQTFTGYKTKYTLFLINGKLDSVKLEEGYYLNDRKEGPWIKYFEDGITPKLIGNYANNRPSGDYIKFYPNSQLKEIGCFIKNLQRDSIKRYM